MERKLTAILCADVYGYSRLMGEDEEATLRTLSSYRKLIDSLIEIAGDSSIRRATASSPSRQRRECGPMRRRDSDHAQAENANIPPERRMEFRIGLNLRDVMVDGEQIYGDGVNVAARLGSLAAPGGICSSRTVREQIRNKLTLNYEDLGEQAVKNRLLPQAQHRPPKRGISPPNWSDLSPWGCASQDHELLMEDHVLLRRASLAILRARRRPAPAGLRT